MRIAIISPWFISPNAVGGTERFCSDLGEQLAIHGHDVTVFMLSGASHITGGIRYESLDFLGDGRIASEYGLQHRLGDFSQSASFDALARYVESRVDSSEFDAFHINSLLFVRAWPKSTRVFTVHTNPYEYQLDWGETSYATAMRLLKDEGHRPRSFVTAPSRHYADIFSGEIGAEITFIPHAIDDARLKAGLSKEQLCAKYGVHPRKITLVLPSRLELTQKRPQIAFEAVADLPLRSRQSLQIIATGLDAQYVQSRIQLQTIADEAGFETHFLRFDDMAEAYGMADIVGLPSKSESFGYAALESLVLEKPTILNSIATYREIADGNPNAHFFEQTSDSFKSVLMRLLKGCAPVNTSVSWRKRYEMGQWARQYEKLFTHEPHRT